MEYREPFIYAYQYWRDLSLSEVLDHQASWSKDIYKGLLSSYLCQESRRSQTVSVKLLNELIRLLILLIMNFLLIDSFYKVFVASRVFWRRVFMIIDRKVCLIDAIHSKLVSFSGWWDLVALKVWMIRVKVHGWPSFNKYCNLISAYSGFSGCTDWYSFIKIGNWFSLGLFSKLLDSFLFYWFRILATFENSSGDNGLCG